MAFYFGQSIKGCCCHIGLMGVCHFYFEAVCISSVLIGIVLRFMGSALQGYYSCNVGEVNARPFALQRHSWHGNLHSWHLKPCS